MKINIVKMQNEHVPAVHQIAKECFTEVWSLDAFFQEIKKQNAITFVAVEAGRVVGFVNAYYVALECYINNIAVTEKSRRQGVGGLLISELINIARQKKFEFITLEVRKSNTSAINFYNKHSFDRVGVRKGFYDNPKEDAVIMTFSLF